MSAERDAGDVLVVGDIGSTFTKLVAVSTAGQVVASVKTPTRRDELAAGVARATELLSSSLGSSRLPEPALSSSAGGGLRIVVLGLEPALTLAAGLRTSATAGARVVATYTPGELAGVSRERFQSATPDLALLTGGTNGGDTAGMVEHAQCLRRLAPGLPVVVAGNREARHAVGTILGRERLVSFTRNVMPRVGAIDGGSAQSAIRRLFVEHVIGRGRFSSAEPVARAIRMPTPVAVLQAAETLAALEGPALLHRPVVVDVGGATTDVHSVIPVDPGGRAYVSEGLPDEAVSRTVEGDLGMRENALSLVEAARRDGFPDESVAGLDAGAGRRVEERDLVPADAHEREIDDRLAGVATTIALRRHAGVMRTVLTPTGAVLRKNGRDLRSATCVIATGGVFAHSNRASEIVREAVGEVHRQGALMAPDVPVLVDRSYLLWAVGLLRDEQPHTAARVVRAALPQAFLA
jgi:uncharacterized protein (TIGR01319 family)